MKDAVLSTLRLRTTEVGEKKQQNLNDEGLCIINLEVIMNLELLRQYTPLLNRIAEKHGIAKLYVFGSVARGESTTKSDVDFLIEMLPDASLFGAAGFSYEAEKLLEKRVDIVPLSMLPEIKDREFVKNIQREAVEL